MEKNALCLRDKVWRNKNFSYLILDKFRRYVYIFTYSQSMGVKIFLSVQQMVRSKLFIHFRVFVRVTSLDFIASIFKSFSPSPSNAKKPSGNERRWMSRLPITCTVSLVLSNNFSLGNYSKCYWINNGIMTQLHYVVYHWIANSFCFTVAMTCIYHKRCLDDSKETIR